MLLMQIVMLITVTIMVIVGIVMLTLYFMNKNNIDKENEKEVLNLRLNIYVSIICFVGAVIIGILIPLIG